MRLGKVQTNLAFLPVMSIFAQYQIKIKSISYSYAKNYISLILPN